MKTMVRRLEFGELDGELVIKTGGNEQKKLYNAWRERRSRVK